MDPQVSTSTEIASYEAYAQARADTDFLSDVDFDVSAITIVGSDLHLVERVRGHLTITRASLSGVSSGGLWGTLDGVLVSAGQSTGGTRTWVAGGIIVGALIGMALPALSFIIRGHSRDLVSSQQVVAQRYAVLASVDMDRAHQILQRIPGNRTRVACPRTEQARPRKDSAGFFPGERPRFGAATKDGGVPGGCQTPEATSTRTDIPVSTPDTPAPMTNSPESAAPAHENTMTSSPEGDQTEA